MSEFTGGAGLPSNGVAGTMAQAPASATADANATASATTGATAGATVSATTGATTGATAGATAGSTASATNNLDEGDDGDGGAPRGEEGTCTLRDSAAHRDPMPMTDRASLFPTLDNVFEAFWAVAATADLWTSTSQHSRLVVFEYDRRMWRATVSNYRAPRPNLAGERVHVIRVHLPHCCDPHCFDALRAHPDDADSEMARLQHAVYARIGGVLFARQELSPGHVHTKYDATKEHVLVRFWDASERFCLSIEWAYESPEEYLDEQVLARGQEWARMLSARGQ